MAIKKHNMGSGWQPSQPMNTVASLVDEINANYDALQAQINNLSTVTAGPMNVKTYFPGGSVNNITTTGQVITSTTFTTSGNPVFILVTGDANPVTPGWIRLQLYRNGSPIGKIVQAESVNANVNVPYCLHHVDTPPAGTYTYSMQMQSGAGGNWQFGEGDPPAMTMIELAGPGVGNTTVQNSITVGAVGTAPAVGTRPVQRIESQTVGDKLRLTYRFGQVAVSAGSGDYLLSLPTGQTFNTTYNPVYTGVMWTGGVNPMSPYLIPATGGIVEDGNWTNQIAIVPYDSTRFRLLVTNNANQGAYQFWSSGFYALNAGSGITLQINFEIWD